MSRELVIVSIEDGAKLTLTAPDESWGRIIVEAQGTDFKVCAPVYVDMCQPLSEFLEEISKGGAAYKEAKVWETFEREFRLEVSRDALGHIYVVCHIRSPDVGSNKWWSFTGRLVLELGTMPLLCKQARRFWNAVT